MKTIIAAAALGATAITGIAVAQTSSSPQSARALRGDSNGDGSLSRAEFVAKAEQRFARMDANRDGRVTREERREIRGGKHRGGKGMRGGRFQRMDADRDGRVSRAEAFARPTRMFDRADTNRDGYIDQAEQQALKGKRAERRGGRDMAPPAAE